MFASTMSRQPSPTAARTAPTRSTSSASVRPTSEWRSPGTVTNAFSLVSAEPVFAVRPGAASPERAWEVLTEELGLPAKPSEGGNGSGSDADAAAAAEAHAAARSLREAVAAPWLPAFSQKGAPYHSLDDLRGKRIGTLSQSYAFNILREKVSAVAKVG